MDTFDLKPNAPKEYRGEFDPIKTNADGVEISEHLPNMETLSSSDIPTRPLDEFETEALKQLSWPTDFSVEWEPMQILHWKSLWNPMPPLDQITTLITFMGLKMEPLCYPRNRSQDRCADF